MEDDNNAGGKGIGIGNESGDDEEVVGISDGGKEEDSTVERRVSDEDERGVEIAGNSGEEGEIDDELCGNKSGVDICGMGTLEGRGGRRDIGSDNVERGGGGTNTGGVEWTNKGGRGIGIRGR
jgi:hypothetical protein